MAGLFGGGRSRESENRWRQVMQALQSGQLADPRMMELAGSMSTPVGRAVDKTMTPSGAMPQPAVTPNGPSPTAPQRSYSIWDRLHDVAADYSGMPTRRDRMQQEAQRAQASQWGSEFAKIGTGVGPANLSEREAMMRSMIAQRAAQGQDVAPFERMAEGVRNNALSGALAGSFQGVPDSVRYATQISPTGGAAYAFDQGGSNIYGGPEGSFYRAAPGSGRVQQLQGPQPGWDWVQRPDGSAAPRPGGPADPKYGYAQNYENTRGRVAATPAEPAPLPTEGNVVAQVLLKAQQVGPEGLNAAERQIFDRATSIPTGGQDLLATLLGGGPAPAPAPRPGAGGAPQQRTAPGGAARPQTQVDFDRLPKGSTYIDPDDGQLYVKE